MATSFLTESFKNSIKDAYSSFHESFSRTITAFKIGQKISLTSNPSYNGFYKKNAAENNLIEQSQEFTARIRYVKMEEEFFTERDGSSFSSNSSRIILPAGSVKLKVDSTGYDYIKEAKRIEFDNKRFAVKHNPRPIAFFSATDFYEFILIPLDE